MGRDRNRRWNLSLDGTVLVSEPDPIERLRKSRNAWSSLSRGQDNALFT